MARIHEILKEVWGYDRFRPLQEEIIQSVLDGKDTLALLPTGGGKSICFQVPALAMEGLCLVISPLIALMKDQVENLISRDIPALAVFSGMSARQIDFELDNCINGKYRFLYVSPERLKTEIFRARVTQMKISLIAVDEAHCISQWGYDFRPEYLQIAELRQFVRAPVMALTATATPEVVQDIQEKLEFRKPNVFRKSFERKNLSYLVLKEENKPERLLTICRKIKGTGVIYARNRKLCRDIAEYLRQNGISADYYHAGLDQKTRNARQDAWIRNQIRVIVSTNAFGMGIDKPDVRFVLHYELPDSLEAYYQEAGRAGRDEQASWCVALIRDHDRATAFQKLEEAFPPYQTVERVYEGVLNTLKIATSSGAYTEHDFDLAAVSEKIGIPAPTVYHALHILEKQEMLRLSDAVHQPAQIHILVDNTVLYDFEIRNPKVAPFIKLLLRSYGGLFDHYSGVDEAWLARQSGLNQTELRELLLKLREAGIIDYVPARSKPGLMLLQDRPVKLGYDQEAVRRRREIMVRRLEAVFNYASDQTGCRSQALLAYFGETGAGRCGNCDCCREDKKSLRSEMEYLEEVSKLINTDIRDLKTMTRALGYWHEEGLQQALQHLLDEGKISINDKQEVSWRVK